MSKEEQNVEYNYDDERIYTDEEIYEQQLIGELSVYFHNQYDKVKMFTVRNNLVLEFANGEKYLYTVEKIQYK